MSRFACPNCPDGYVWNREGQTGNACPTCKGKAYLEDEDEDYDDCEAETDDVYASVSKTHSDEETYGLHINSVDSCSGCSGATTGSGGIVATGGASERRGGVEMTDVIERAQAWLSAADESGINRTDKYGYLSVIEDLVIEELVAEAETLRGSLEGYRNEQLRLIDELEQCERIRDALGVELNKRHAIAEMLAAVVQGAKEEFVKVPYGASHEDVTAINEWHEMAQDALSEWSNK